MFPYSILLAWFSNCLEEIDCVILHHELKKYCIMSKVIVGLALFVGSFFAVSCGNSAYTEQQQEYPVMTVGQSDVTIDEAFTASIEGRQDVEIYPQLSGKISKVCIKEGQSVKQGQILFIIDQVPYQAALRMATANVHAAQATLETARLERDSKKELLKENVISDYELRTAENSLLAAQAALEQAQAQEIDARNNLSYTEIKSPVNGVAGVLPFRTGALVSPQISQPLTIVSDNSEMYAYFSISEKQLQDIIGQYGSMAEAIAGFPEVSLKLSNGKKYKSSGKIETISGVINPQTGTASIKAIFPNNEGLLLSGNVGNVIFPHTEKNVIVIPQSATYEIQDKVYAVKVVDGKASVTELGVSRYNDGHSYLVKSGLAVGDTIVSEGTSMLQDGQEIKIKTQGKEQQR
jgi:efflux transporter, RND family, MFP subunit